MDLHEKPALDVHDFFAETAVPLRIPAPPSEVGESVCPQGAFTFSIEDCLLVESLALPPQAPSESAGLQDGHDTDTNPLQELLGGQWGCDLMEGVGQGEGRECIPESELQHIIDYLVVTAGCGRAELRAGLQGRFPQWGGSAAVQELADKFAGLKKTKEELVKYCMRKAFKFILQLPRNRHMLREGGEEASFSKCKSRYLRNISEEKSMNSKFLRQIFSDPLFAADYSLFLDSFEEIMREDNARKVRYLARVVGGGEGVGAVKRLPWTSAIMGRVRRIGAELLRCGE